MGKIVYARAITSTLLFISFFVVFFTGVGLYISPSGRVARETSWSFFGLTRDTLTLIHTYTAFIMSALIFIHIALNFGMYASEMRILARRIRKE